MKTNLNLVQNESNSKACYETFAFNRVHKYGFICCNTGDDYVCLETFDDVESFVNLFGWDNNDFVEFYNELVTIPVGASMSDDCDMTWTRLW